MISFIAMPIKYADPGVCQNILTVKILDANGNDVTGNYIITYKYGTLTVYFDPTAM